MAIVPVVQWDKDVSVLPLLGSPQVGGDTLVLPLIWRSSGGPGNQVNYGGQLVDTGIFVGIYPRSARAAVPSKVDQLDRMPLRIDLIDFRGYLDGRGVSRKGRTAARLSCLPVPPSKRG